MAGPNLTGWTASSLAPVAQSIVGPEAALGISKSYGSAAERDASQAQTKARVAQLVAAGADPAGFDPVTGEPLNLVSLRLIYPDMQIGSPTPAQAQSDVIGGLAPNYGSQVAGSPGGPSLSGPQSGWTTSPMGVPIPPSTTAPIQAVPLYGNSQTTTTTGSPTDKYNLTAADYGEIPAPKKPSTPLEQLLRTIYPDAPEGEAGPGYSATSTGFSDVVAYLTQQSSGGSGYVQAPQLAAPTTAVPNIPGAPAWLGPQIAALPTGGGVFTQAPSSGGNNMNLAGLAAIAAEQRMQQAVLDAELKRKNDVWLAMADAAAKAKKN